MFLLPLWRPSDNKYDVIEWLYQYLPICSIAWNVNWYWLVNPLLNVKLIHMQILILGTEGFDTKNMWSKYLQSTIQNKPGSLLKVARRA